MKLKIDVETLLPFVTKDTWVAIWASSIPLFEQLNTPIFCFFDYVLDGALTQEKERITTDTIRSHHLIINNQGIKPFYLLYINNNFDDRSQWSSFKKILLFAQDATTKVPCFNTNLSINFKEMEEIINPYKIKNVNLALFS